MGHLANAIGLAGGQGPPMLRADRNRWRHAGAKHGSFAQAQENLLQSHGLSVSDCGAMTYSLPPLNAVRAFETAARHLSFKLAAHECT